MTASHQWQYCLIELWTVLCKAMTTCLANIWELLPLQTCIKTYSEIQSGTIMYFFFFLSKPVFIYSFIYLFHTNVLNCIYSFNLMGKKKRCLLLYCKVCVCTGGIKVLSHTWHYLWCHRCAHGPRFSKKTETFHFQQMNSCSVNLYTNIICTVKLNTQRIF